MGRGVNFQIELSDLEPLVKRLQTHKVPLFRELKETWYDKALPKPRDKHPALASPSLWAEKRKDTMAYNRFHTSLCYITLVCYLVL